MKQQYRAEIEERETHGGEMTSHMMTLFDETCQMAPGLIVELGVRKGMSTFALERAARISGAKMVSVDIMDCSTSVQYAQFVLADDLRLAARFEAFCVGLGMFPSIDVLLIDTSHTYDQTEAEIKAWLPWLAPACKILFHDTNPSPAGRNRAAPDGKYGVAAAINDWLQREFPWNTYFEDVVGEWSIRHNPTYMGLTIFERSGRSD